MATLSVTLVEVQGKSTPMALLLLFLLLPMAMLCSSADLLQNPDFESPPVGLPVNSTAGEFTLLNQNTTLPGWSFEGTVYYVTADKSVSLPGGDGTRHAIQLGPDGKINQTFTASATAYTDYLLTLTLTSASLGGAGGNCTAGVGAVVSAPDSRSELAVRKSYAEAAWQSYGVYLGSWSDGESINVVIESQSTESDANSTCWPIVDSLLLKTFGSLVKSNDIQLLNGGFESGPEFLSGSAEGILLDTAISPLLSPLRQWAITGIIKYIDSSHFHVPEGTAAVELISGNSTGIQTAATLPQDSSYIVDFLLGDANDSCVGDLQVQVQAGSTLGNFSIQSNGTGSAQRFSVSFKASAAATTISFASPGPAALTKDGVLCGLVIDDVVLRASDGLRRAIWWKQVLVGILFVTAAII